MVSTLIVPQKMLEEMREKGKKESRRDREATAILIGQYNCKRDSIRVLEKIDLFTKIGDGSFFGNLYDNIKDYLCTHRILYVTLRTLSYRIALKNAGKSLAFVLYHSHGYIRRGTWSSADLKGLHTLKNLEHTHTLGNVSTAFMLYRADIDNFEVIDENKNPVKLEVI